MFGLIRRSGTTYTWSGFVLAGSLMLVAVGTARAEVCEPIPGDVANRADEAGSNWSDEPEFFDLNQRFYTVAYDPSGGIDEYEYALELEPGITYLDSVTRPLGTTNSAAFPNFVVSTGTCLAGATVALTEHRYALFLPEISYDLLLCVGAAEPSSFDPASAGYRSCEPESQLHQFTYVSSVTSAYPDGCLVLFPTGLPPVRTGSVSMGTVKARF